MGEVRTIRVGLVGLGTVGVGVYTILRNEHDVLLERTGVDARLVRIADVDLDRDRGVEIDRSICVTDYREITDRPDIDIVVELVGGVDAAGEIIERAIENGKDVVTANKYLLAVRGRELFRMAAEKGRSISFEASVCAGIPIISAVRNGLVANRITSIGGILNGTSNYVLDRMTSLGICYEEALSEAQKLGYAEHDPTLDVGGGDAAHKLAILASLAFDTPVDLNDILVEGIAGTKLADIQFAAEMGYVLKLLAVGRRAEGEKEEVELRVHPTLLSKEHPLSSVGGAFNAVWVHGSSVGDMMYYGRGAGREPSASAVVADIVEVARGGAGRDFGVIGPLRKAKIPVRPIEKTSSRYYVRLAVLDRFGVLAAVARVFGENHISISSMMQKEQSERAPVPLIFLTHKALEADMCTALDEIEKFEFVTDKPVTLRVLDDGP